MKFDISSIQFSFVDKKKRIRLPSELGKKLANFIGIHLGDGNIHINPKKYENQINCTGHLFDEHQWYLDYLIPLVKDLFNVSPYLYKDKRLNNSSIKITYRSKAIVGFLVNVLGLPPGKKDKWGIPFCIKRAPIELKREFLKGFGDTDFSLSFSKRNKGLHKYPTISLGTSNTPLTKDLIQLIQKLGFQPYFNLNFQTKRKGKKHNSNRIEINGKKNLEKWMMEIGFSSPKHLTKYEIWKKYGFCPPYTTLAEREEILAGNEKLIKKYKEKLING